MQDYVLGFALSPFGRRVALIRKNRPAWQAGRFNGIGGKTEQGESPADAMAREFFEESGCQTAPEAWAPFALLTGPGYRVVVFRTELSEVQLSGLRSATDETVIVVETDTQAWREGALDNVELLVGLASGLKAHEFVHLDERPRADMPPGVLQHFYDFAGRNEPAKEFFEKTGVSL